MINDEDRRVLENVTVIRSYLTNSFPDFNISERPDPHVQYLFTVSQAKPSYKSYKLQVGWPQLSDRSNTPESVQRLLASERIAQKMREAEGQIVILK